MPEVNPAVNSAATGGYWRDQGQSGNYRIVIFAFLAGEDHLVYETYGQWLSLDEQTQKVKVLKTTKISELSDLAARALPRAPGF